MAKDPEKHSDFEDQDEREDDAGVEEVEEVAGLDRPRCPRCGWHNTRLSHTKNVLDSILRTFSFRAYRCRSCGKRFRAIRRVPKE